MQFNIITAFPEFFQGTFCSIFKRAIRQSILSINVINIREYGIGKHKKIDDTPYGGGAGLILRADVLHEAIEKNNLLNSDDSKIIITSPRGKLFNNNITKEYSSLKQLTIITNRFEAVDQRVIEYHKIEEISIGNFILLGGEVASVAIIESTARLLKNFVNNDQSILDETNQEIKYIQHDQFTKPQAWKNILVPEVLTSGNHLEIEKWRKQNSKNKIKE